MRDLISVMHFEKRIRALVEASVSIDSASVLRIADQGHEGHRKKEKGKPVPISVAAVSDRRTKL